MTLRIIAATKIISTCQAFIGCVLFGLMVMVKAPTGTLKPDQYIEDLNVY
jgi:hypothetical protein